MEIWTINNGKGKKLLRSKLEKFDFSKFRKSEIKELVKKMRGAMENANGIGLSANQIGLNYRIFVAETPTSQGGRKFYAIFNPEITKLAPEIEELEEGCLSVPNQYGLVKRSKKVVLEGQNIDGKKIKIKARGLLAIIFQHEVDHLNGKLFIDKSKNIRTYKKSENYKI